MLLIETSNRVYVAEVNAPDAEPHLLFEMDRDFNALEISPDDTRFLMRTSDDMAMQTPTRVVVNWLALLKNAR